MLGDTLSLLFSWLDVPTETSWRYRIMRLRLSAIVVALLAGLGLAAPALASTGGTPDTENRYSNVGLIAFYSDGLRLRCSATLVSPTVLLTAAHCTDGVDGRTLVT